MSTPYKPEGYSTVSPYLIVNGADSTIAFLEKVFGAKTLHRIATESGKVMHAEVRLHDSVIMLGDAVPPGWPAAESHVHVYVPDVDDSYNRALAAGALSVQQPTKRQDPNKRAAVRDAAGTTWWIATRIE